MKQTEPKTALDLSPSMWRKYRPFRENKKKPSVLSSYFIDARNTAKIVASELAKTFGAKKIVLYGSLATGNFTRWSDIDIAVWGIQPTVFYRAVAFTSGFSSIWRIDLVDAEDCPDTLLKKVLQEGVEL